MSASTLLHDLVLDTEDVLPLSPLLALELSKSVLR
jgi:hypothetical protein